MIRISFSGAGMLAGLANMLELLGYHTSDTDIALGMEAPYLLTREECCYRAGAGLYRPQWLNLYLQPRGYIMAETILSRSEVPAFLRAHSPAMLKLKISPSSAHPVVFTGYEDRKYTFVNIKSSRSPEPDQFVHSAAALRNRLADTVAVYTLEPCAPQPVSFVPLLLDSLTHLTAYEADLLAARQKTVTRAEFDYLRQTLLRPLMQDLPPLIPLTGDMELAEELRRLNHDYRHIFMDEGTSSCTLSDHLPKSSIRRCIAWLREIILDRLYALGISDELLESLYPDSQHTPSGSI